MFQGGTVKQFKDILDEMKKIYPYNDEKTRLCTIDVMSRSPRSVQIVTLDEATDIEIVMSKAITVDDKCV